MENPDLIDRYLFGQLTAQEEKEILVRRDSDPEFATALKERQSIFSGLEALGNEKMKEEIKDQAAPTRKLSVWITMAAAIALLVFFAWQFLFPATVSSADLFAQSYEPYAASITTRDVAVIENLQKADAYYKAKEYETAIPFLIEAHKSQPNNSNLELTLGNAFLTTGQIEKAKTYFEAIIRRGDALYLDQARWYLALSCLKNDEIEACENNLMILGADPKADFHQEAKALLEKL